MDWSALRRNPVTSFGITFTEQLAQQWRQFAPNCVSHEAAYGLSETHTVDTAMPVDAIRWGTQGKPVPGNQIRIVDPDTGAPLPVGTVGEITIQGPGNFKGYWNKPEATAPRRCAMAGCTRATWARSTRTATSPSSAASRK
jgi:long-chain acyl-CoA synthetase